MSINIHTMYVDRDTVCKSTYSMSIGIHTLMYLERHTVCQLTYSMSIDIHVVYVDPHTVCRSTYYMSIKILYVDRQLFPTAKYNYRRKSMQEKRFHNDSEVQIENSITRVTARHHSASLVMPNSYPRDGTFNQHLTTIKDSYILALNN